MPENEQLTELMEEVRAYRKETTEAVKALGKILLGNGAVGLCEQMRTTQSNIKAIWALIGVFGATLLAGVVKFFFAAGG